MTVKLEDKIQDLKTKLEQAEARQAMINNQSRIRNIKKTRSLQTKRKVLLGAMLEQQMEDDEAIKAEVMERLDKFLVRPKDREAFGLDPLPEDKHLVTVTN